MLLHSFICRSRAALSRIGSLVILAGLTLVMIGFVNTHMRVFTVADGNDTRSVAVLSADPAAALKAAGITLKEGDRLTAAAEDPYRLSVTRAYNVRVTVDGSTRLVRMTDGTVRDALALADVSVSHTDSLSVPGDQSVREGLDIQIHRVQYKEYTVKKTLAHTTEVRYTNTLPQGSTHVEQEGHDGTAVYTYRRRIVDGRTAATELVSKEVTVPPQNRVLLKGTVVGTPLSPCPFDIELDEAGQPLHYQKVLTGDATAYYTSRPNARTATGRRAQVGVIAVDPRRIPYGSELYVVSPSGSYVYGYAIAGDTGNGVRAGRTVADLYMPSLAECYRFGRRPVNVYVLR